MQLEDSDQQGLSYSEKYEQVKLKIPELPQLPVPKKKLINFLHTCDNSQLATMVSRIEELNRLAIEEKFISMMGKIFIVIEPQLTAYRKYQSIEYLDHLILSNLDRQIYHKGYKLHKSKQTPMSQLLLHREVDIANRLFTELFDIMNELLMTMKIFYGYESDESISEALYEAIGQFIQKNEQSIIVKEDRLSMALEEKQKQEKKKNKNKETSSYEIVIDVLQAASKQQNGGILNKASNFVGVFYKYGISPAVDTVYDAIKALNPLAKTQKITKEEQEKLKLDLITHLLPHLSVRQPLQEKLVTFLVRLVPMDSEEILQTMGSTEIEKFTALIGKVLNDFQNPSKTFKQVVQELMNLLNLALCCQASESDEYYNDFQQGKWLILLYKALEPKYNPERRRLLLSICRYPEISQKLINPVGILKLVESQSLTESELLGKIRKLFVSEKDETSEERKAHQQKNQEISLAVEHELHRIHLYELKKKYKNPPLLEIEKLTHHSAKRTITFLFSGFMSQDTNKVDQWEGVLDSIYDSEIYSVRWESKSYGDVFDFAVQAGKDIAKANLSIGILGQIGGPYLRAVAIIRELYKKYHSNPFNPAFQSAEITGEFLAELIIADFEGHFINLVGFSLGAELIKNILKKLSEKKKLQMINKIYLMGGICDKTEFEKIIEQAEVPLNIINLHSDNDSTLKYFLKMCKPSIQPIGLYPLREDIHGQIVQNQDCTNIIQGHLDYRKNLKVLDKLLNIKDD